MDLHKFDYKGYTGGVRYDSDSDILFGYVDGLGEEGYFEGIDWPSVESAFKLRVEILTKEADPK